MYWGEVDAGAVTILPNFFLGTGKAVNGREFAKNPILAETHRPKTGLPKRSSEKVNQARTFSLRQFFLFLSEKKNWHECHSNWNEG